MGIPAGASSARQDYRACMFIADAGAESIITAGKLTLALVSAGLPVCICSRVHSPLATRLMRMIKLPNLPVILSTPPASTVSQGMYYKFPPCEQAYRDNALDA